MSGHEVEITPRSVVLDGKDISGLVTAAAVRVEVDECPVVRLTLMPHSARSIVDNALVELDIETTDLLIGLGWTPPSTRSAPTESP